MQYIRDHWPEFLLMALLLMCGTAPLALPLAPWLRFALVPVGWLLAFGLWAVTIGVACWLYPVNRQP